MSKSIKARITIEVTISHRNLTESNATNELTKLSDSIKRISLPYSIGTPLLSLDSVDATLVNRHLHPEIPDK